MEACHVILTGTHRGELAGIPATGKSVEFDCTDIIRVEDGKVAEHWGTTDNMSLMQQIGAVAYGLNKTTNDGGRQDRRRAAKWLSTFPEGNADSLLLLCRPLNTPGQLFRRDESGRAATAQ